MKCKEGDISVSMMSMPARREEKKTYRDLPSLRVENVLKYLSSTSLVPRNVHSCIGDVHTSLGVKSAARDPGRMRHTCHSGTWEAETGGSGFQGHPWLQA